MAVGLTRRRWVRWFASLLALALVAGACGGDDDGESQAPAVVETTEDIPAEPDTGGDETGQPADAATGPEPDDQEPDDQEPLTAPVDTTTTAPPQEEDGEDDPAEPEPQFGGTLRVGVEAESDGLNPAANNFAVSAYIMTHPIFDPVAYWNTDGEWIPYLAESFTKIGDGTSWQMKLREGVLFHDGSELDAADAVATLQAQIADPIVSLAIRPLFDPDEPVVQIDEYTVEYRLIKPSARLPIYITSQLGMMLPSEWLARALEDPTLNQMPVGQGPFMIESRVQDDVTVLVPFPDYWAADRTDIYLDRIEIYPITDTAVAAERLAAGDLDLIVTDNAEAILTLREADGVYTLTNQRADEAFAIMNTSRPPFDDIRVRQALTFATDRDAYVQLIGQGVNPSIDTLFHEDLIWHNPDVVQETNMAERAGPLIESYCADNPDNCADGRVNIEFQHSGPSVLQTRIADLLSDSWEDHFNVNVQELLQDQHILEAALGLYDVITWRQFGAVDPDNDVLWLECASISAISLNWPRYCDPARDALMDEQRAIEDLDRRVEIWHEISQNIRDAYTYIFFNSSSWTVGARDRVQNICGQTSPVDGTPLFCNNQGRLQLHQVWLR